MATYPNNYRTGVGFLPNYAFYGIMPYFQYNAEIGSGAGSRMNCHIGTDGIGFPKTASTPDGYGMKTPFPPIKAGGISAWNDPVVDFQMTGALIQGGAMQGSADITFGQSGDLSMVVSMAGTAAVVTLNGDSMVLRMTVGLSGNGSFQLTGTNNLALIVPFEGAGSVVTMGAGGTDLRELLSMSGQWTPFTELSPEGLANAVWSSLAAANNSAGSMGELLNSAGAAGDPLLGIVEGPLTLRDVQRIVLAVLAGQVTGAGTGTETFKGQAGEDRVVSTVDANGNRSSVTLDAS